MKKLSMLLISIILIISASACVSPEDKGGNGMIDITPIVPEGYLKLEVGNNNGRTTEGFGTQVDTHIFKTANGNLYTEEDLAEWLSRIDEMNLQSIRTQVFPEWYERGNDNNDYNVFDYNSPNVDFDSIEMQQLYKLLDICEERDIKVDLSFYGCNRIFASQDGKINGSWLANTYDRNWITAPKLVDSSGNAFPGYEEYAESVYALLNYLINVLGYTCLYEYSIFPEPNISFYNAQGVSIDSEYAAFYNIVKAKLDKEGITGKILCAGPGDNAYDAERYIHYTDLLKDVYDKNNSSVYQFNNESTNKQMYDFAKRLVEICDTQNKTWGVCESGTNRFIDPANQSDIDTYDRAIFLARMVINYVNAGATNIKYWVLNDVWYDGYVMRLGLWKLADEQHKAEARPQFYTWSLITRYTDFGSSVYPVSSEDSEVCMVAFKLPDGSWSYMIANAGKHTKKVSVVSRYADAQGTMKLYEVSGSTLPMDNKVVKASRELKADSGVISLTLKANSFTVISNKA